MDRRYTSEGKHRLLPIFAAGALLLLGSAAWAREDGGDKGAVKLLKTVQIPGSATNTTGGKMYVFDISFVDQATQTYYLADRSNAVVDVVDAKTGTFVKQIAASPPFRGFSGKNDTSGPDGVVAAFPWLFVTDAKSRVVTIDLRTGATVSDVSTGGADSFRADELAYDPRDGLLLVVNNADDPPFATLVSVNKATGKLTVGKRITFDAAHGVDATNGAEQPVWDPGTGRFYISIPELSGNGGTGPMGAVARITTTGTVERLFEVDFCQPAGLTLGPREDLLVGCSVVFDTAGKAWDEKDTNSAAPQQVILDAKTGAIDRHVRGVGGSDEVWFNSGDGNYYTASRNDPLAPHPGSGAQGAAILGVIDAEDQNLMQEVPTFNVPAVTTGTNQHPAGTAHSVAANAKNNHVFVPLPANNAFPGCLTGCIAVFGRPSDDE